VCEREREREGREGGREKLTGRERREEGEREEYRMLTRREGQRGRRGREGECGCRFGERLYEEVDKRAFASSRAFFAFSSASGLGCTCARGGRRRRRRGWESGVVGGVQGVGEGDRSWWAYERCRLEKRRT